MSSDDQKRGILLESGNNEVEFLEFIVAGASFGLNVSKVCQTTLFSEHTITHLPNAPEGIIGTTHFRDVPIIVIDLKSILGKGDIDSEHPRQLLLITEFNSRQTAFIIDDVIAIKRCSWKDFKRLDQGIYGSAESYVIGTLPIEDRIVMMLDVEAILGELDPTMRIQSLEVSLAEHMSERSDIRIVYCEDSSIVQKLLTKTLAQAGYTNVTCFDNGQLGLDYLSETDPNTVDIILSDIEMPQMDGLTLCNRVRETEGYEETPFIFFSSIISPPMRKKCESVGGDECYSKPEIDNIIRSIDNKFNLS